MIGPDRLRRAEYIIDESGVLDVLRSALRKDPRGCRYDEKKPRVILIGLLLSIETRRTGAIRKVVDLVYNDLPLDEQYRLGIKDPATGKWLVTEHDFYNFTRKFNDRLAYGPSVPDHSIDEHGVSRGITVEEREERHAAVQRICQVLLSTTFVGPDPTVFAIDATGIWAWCKGRDPQKMSQLTAEMIEVDSLAPDLIPLEPPAVPSDITIEVAERSLYDPDAHWSFKTSKSGKTEGFFGYHEHTLVQVPASDDDRDDAPRLIRAFELTPASLDVVDVSLRLLDTVHDGDSKRLLLADRLYHYSAFPRWWQPLHRRGWGLVHDLRKEEHGFVEYDRMRWVAGHAHCPATPDTLGTIVRPAVDDKRKASREKFERAIKVREAHALVRHNLPDENGMHRVMCPALAGKVGCPLRAGTVPTAQTFRLPLIEKPPSASDPEGLPTCCTQKTVLVRPPEQVAKALQPVYWGSREWADLYGRRTYVEGSYGNRKNSSTENLRRGLFHVTGLPLVHLMMAMVNVSYNLRMVENWYLRNLDRDRPRQVLPADHPLLFDDSRIAGYRTVTNQQEFGADAYPNAGGPSSVKGQTGKRQVRRKRKPALASV